VAAVSIPINEVCRNYVNSGSTIRKRQTEAGIALLISIFILLLISVVAIALIVSSGTESALAGNYRSSTGVYYDALAGIEEARGRLAGKGPSGFKATDPTTFLPPAGTPLAMGNTYYLINPVSGEAVTPWDLSSPYPDKEFFPEFATSGFTTPTSPSPTALSIWNKAALNPGNYPGPLYKWVRINAVSEKSLNVDADADGNADATTPLYYDNTNPSHPFSNTIIPGYQVIELTAFAVLPNGSQKILQYVVVPTPVTLPPFDAALMLSGSNGGSYPGTPFFQAPANNASFAVQGNDNYYGCSGYPLGPSKAAIGLFGDYSGNSSSPDITNIKGGIATNVPPGGTDTRPNYTGQNPAPDVEYLYPGQTPAQLDAIVQTITQNADVVMPSGPVTYPLPTITASALTSLGMSSTNPLTIVINGNLDVTNWAGTGYGFLLVIGKLTYDPSVTWNGIVFVVGQGQVGNTGHLQYQQINGAMFVAKTRDTSGNLLGGRIGGASVSFDPPMQGNGIYYSSCWIKKATPTGAYKILSFHEIAQ
jgi:hypothetical protein